MGGLLLGQLLAWGGGLPAQESATVLGRVLDDESRAPVVGAFVALLDEAGERRAAVLSDATGRFILRAPAPGRFRLRTERIGMESVFSDFFTTSPGQVLTREILTRPAAVALAGLEVTGGSRCDLGADEGSATVRLWEEARKALEVAEWVDEVGYIYETRTFERYLDRTARRVRREESQLGQSAGRGAFRSLDAETLVTHGFIRDDGRSQVYYAPDAAVLLSDAFLSSHCFRAVRENGRLGLDFEPAPDRQVRDIEGTLWFSGEGRLDRLEFLYREHLEYREARLGGEIDFVQLDEGAWIVREWRIRMPQFEVRANARGDRFDQQLIGVHEVGGEVRSARRQARIDNLYSARRGAVQGAAVQGETGAPLVGAEVYLSGTGYAATTSGDGSFLLEDVLPGIYRMVVEHPSVAALGEITLGHQVEVRADTLVSTRVEIPSRREVLLQRCEPQELLEISDPDRREGPPSIVGGVVVDEDGRPVANWPVRVRWTRYDINVAGAMRESWRGSVVFSGPRGGWEVCGLPLDVRVTVETADARLMPSEAEEGEGDWGRSHDVGRLQPGEVVWVEARSGG